MEKQIISLIVLLLITAIMPSIIVSGDFTLYETLSFGGQTTVEGNVATNMSDESPTNQSTGVLISTSELSIYIADADGDTFDWTIESSVGTSSANGESDGTKTCSITGLTYDTTYYWYVNSTDIGTGNWTNNTYWFTTELEISEWVTLSFGGSATALGQSPMLSDEYPENESTNIAMYPELSITVDEPQDQNFDINWSTNVTGTWTNFAVNSSVVDGTYTQNATFFNESDTTYWWQVNVSDINEETKLYYFDAYSASSTYWFLNPDDMCDNDTSTSAATDVHNQSQLLISNTCLGGSGDIGTVEIRTYGARANSNDAHIDFRPVFGGNTNGTNISWTPPSQLSQKAPSSWYDITTDVGSPDPWIWTDIQNLDINVTLNCSAENNGIHLYYFQVRISPEIHKTIETYHFTTAEYTWGNWSEWWAFTYAHENFTTPTYFNATHYDSEAINLTWVKSDNTTTTYVIRKIDSAPTNITDGTNVYNGTLETYNDTGLGYGTHFYYAAFSYNETLNTYTDDFVLSDNYTNPGIPSGLSYSDKTMNEITLIWTKGINATNTTIRYSDYAYPVNASSNLSAYNNTGATIEVSGLTSNTTYYFRAWSYNPDSGLLSETNISFTNSTVAEAYTPLNLEAHTDSDTQIDVNWTRAEGTLYTTVLRKEGEYPASAWDTTAEIIYNSTGLSVEDTGLSIVVHYYYRAWGWNGEEHSSGYVSADNKTFPSPPVDMRGSLEGTELTIEWEKGTGATRTVIRNATDNYPSSPTDGYHVYNDTDNITSVSGVTTVDYYRSWSYALLNGSHLYSEYANLVWGGLEINVYKEPNPTINITNYTVFITNQDGSETYEALDQTNPTRIDVSEVPNGEDISIQISKEGYHPRIKYLDMFENQWYSINFYLPPDTEGGGDEDDDDYIPPEDEEQNESYGDLYYVRVVETYETSYGTFDRAVEDAKVTFRRYINTTEEYDTISSLFTDANGYVNLYLIPSVLYQVIIEKDGYDTKIADYQPAPPNAFGQTAEKVFRISTTIDYTDYEPDSVFNNITWTFEPRSVQQTSQFTVYFNITSSDCKLEWYRMRVWYYNRSNSTWVSLSNQNESNACGGSLSYLLPNVTGKYAIECFYKKEGFSEFECFQQGSLVMFFSLLKQGLQDVPDYVFFLVLIVIMAVVMGFFYWFFGTGIVTGYIGLTVFAIGLLMKPLEIVVAVDTETGVVSTVSAWVIFAITFIMYTIGIYLWSKI